MCLGRISRNGITRSKGMNTLQAGAIGCYILPKEQYKKMPFALSPFHYWETSCKKICACFEEKEPFLTVDIMSISLIASEVRYFPQSMPSLSVLFV